MTDLRGKEKVSNLVIIAGRPENLAANPFLEQRLRRHPEHPVGEFVAHQFAKVVHFICGADNGHDSEFPESPILFTSVDVEVLVAFGEFSHDTRFAVPIIPERRAYPTNPSTLPLSLPLAGRPNLSANK